MITLIRHLSNVSIQLRHEMAHELWLNLQHCDGVAKILCVMAEGLHHRPPAIHPEIKKLIICMEFESLWMERSR